MKKIILTLTALTVLSACGKNFEAMDPKLKKDARTLFDKTDKDFGTPEQMKGKNYNIVNSGQDIALNGMGEMAHNIITCDATVTSSVISEKGTVTIVFHPAFKMEFKNDKKQITIASEKEVCEIPVRTKSMGSLQALGKNTELVLTSMDEERTVLSGVLDLAGGTKTQVTCSQKNDELGAALMAIELEACKTTPNEAMGINGLSISASQNGQEGGAAVPGASAATASENKPEGSLEPHAEQLGTEETPAI